MGKNEGLISDPLFVGLTRPPMLWGVTYSAFLLNTIVTMQAFVWTHNLIYLLMFVPVHLVCFAICKKDPRTFDIFLLWARTKGASLLGNGYFGGVLLILPLILLFQREEIRE